MTLRATFLKPAPLATTAIAAATGAWLAWTPIAGADTQPGEVADLVARVSPAVVTVLATQDGGDAQEMAGMPEGSPFGPGSPFDEFMRRFGMPEMGPRPQGSRRARSSTAPRASRSARASSSTTRASSSPTTTSSTTPSR